MTSKAAENRSPLPRFAVVVAFLVILALLIWRELHGLDWTDEPFYASEAWRIVLGDSVFGDIWSRQQLSSMMCSPLVAAYTGIVGKTDGILLFLRLVYLFACVITALLLYFSSRKRAGRLWAFLASVPPLATLSPITFSYNTIQLLGFFAACAFLFAAQQASDKRRSVLLIVAGICCGLSFIAYPLTLIALPLMCIWLLLEPGFGTRLSSRARNLIPLASGCAICLVLIAAFVFINSSFETVINNWQNLSSAKVRVRSPFDLLESVVKAYGIKSTVVLIVTCIIAHVSTIAKDARTRRILRSIVLLGAAAIVIWQYVRAMGNFSVMQVQVQMYFAIASIGFVLFFLNKHRWNQCIWMFLLGAVVSIAVYLGTSNGVNWYVYPFMLSTSAVLLYCPTMANCPDGDEPIVGHLVLKAMAAFATAALLVAFAAFYTYVYRDAPLQELDTQLTSGPAAGLITTSERAELYYSMVDTIQEYAPTEGNVLFLNVFPFGYLCTDATPATGSPFSPNVNAEKFSRYYDLNPNKIPSVIFCVSGDYFGEKNGDVKLGTFLEAYMQQHKYSRIETPEATIFVRET